MARLIAGLSAALNSGLMAALNSEVMSNVVEIGEGCLDVVMLL
jgi:hypothetical protein